MLNRMVNIVVQVVNSVKQKHFNDSVGSSIARVYVAPPSHIPKSITALQYEFEQLMIDRVRFRQFLLVLAFTNNIVCAEESCLRKEIESFVQLNKTALNLDLEELKNLLKIQRFWYQVDLVDHRFKDVDGVTFSKAEMSRLVDRFIQ